MLDEETEKNKLNIIGDEEDGTIETDMTTELQRVTNSEMTE